MKLDTRGSLIGEKPISGKLAGSATQMQPANGRQFLTQQIPPDRQPNYIAQRTRRTSPLSANLPAPRSRSCAPGTVRPLPPSTSAIRSSAHCVLPYPLRAAIHHHEAPGSLAAPPCKNAFAAWTPFGVTFTILFARPPRSAVASPIRFQQTLVSRRSIVVYSARSNISAPSPIRSAPGSQRRRPDRPVPRRP